MRVGLHILVETSAEHLSNILLILKISVSDNILPVHPTCIEQIPVQSYIYEAVFNVLLSNPSESCACGNITGNANAQHRKCQLSTMQAKKCYSFTL